MFMIELHNATTLDLWVLDTGCHTHICTVLQGLKESRRLKHKELNLVMGNRKIMLVTRIGNHNGNMILNVGSSNELDKSKLWHSRLGYLNKKCIARLQKDGVLESFDFKSDDVCQYCLLGKTTKSPFTGSCKRARRGVFLEREMISKEDNKSKIDLEEIQKSTDEEPIVNTNTQPEVVTLVKPNDISLPIQDKISDSTLSELDEPANYKEAMASPEAAKWNEAIKSEI
ncbi:retrotransposon protein, putative, ty1-copia subclass [Tanacetum coccineum]